LIGGAGPTRQQSNDMGEKSSNNHYDLHYLWNKVRPAELITGSMKKN
jgi:hypothetical protein